MAWAALPLVRLMGNASLHDAIEARFDQVERRLGVHAVSMCRIESPLARPLYGIEVVGEACDGWEAIRLAQWLQPDVILMDLLMPNLDGIQATRAVLKQNPRARILVLTSDESEASTLAAVRAGALGLVPKYASTDALIRTVHGVAADQFVIARKLAAALVSQPSQPDDAKTQTVLTDREREVLGLLVAGSSNAEIGRAMKISTATVRSHVSHILPKLNATNRTQAAINAVALGLVAN